MKDQRSGSARGVSKFSDLPMRVGVGQFMDPNPERLRFIKQLGINDVLLNMYDTELLTNDDCPLSGESEWDFGELVQLRNRLEDAGLRLNALENMPIRFYEDIMLNGPSIESQFEHVKRTVRNVGEAGIPILGYHWAPNGIWRSSTSRRVRGGAEATAYDASDLEEVPLTHGRMYDEAEIWKNYERFIEEVIPVAEEAGVTLALHPNDPPVEQIGGIPFLFRNFNSINKAMDLSGSDHHQIELCLGTWAEMGEDLTEVITHFGDRDKIAYVHFRNVQGAAPSFNETFIDDGDFDEFEILRALDDMGFNGMMIPDHVPRMEGDGEWKRHGRAYTVGYLKSMVRSLETT